MEYENEPDTNGEYWLLDQVLGFGDDETPLLVDIGANKGDWTQRAVEIMRLRGTDGRVIAFEPASQTYQHMTKRFTGVRAVVAHRMAVTDFSGETEFFVVGELAGTNSLSGSTGGIPEKINCIQFDNFVDQQRIDRIRFVKSDTEGYDMKVLLGARKLLSGGRIDVWQFEYNHRWAFGRYFLKDVFDFFADKPYRIGKLYGNGIECYDTWHPELERFFETNYVLIRRGSDLEGLCRRASFDTSNVAVFSSG
jgi:FkbM family methyltransferase